MATRRVDEWSRARFGASQNSAYILTGTLERTGWAGIGIETEAETEAETETETEAETETVTVTVTETVTEL